MRLKLLRWLEQFGAPLKKEFDKMGHRPHT